MPTQPFQEFARHYDRFMVRYVDYPGWVDYVEKIFRKFKVEPKTVLDLACGTGLPTVLMAKRGYRMVGVDRSEDMLRVLRAKETALPVRTLRADMTDFRLDSPVDAGICLYDSINYLLSGEELVECFSCVRQALADGGLFVFDMNTVYSLSTFWGNRLTPRNVDGVASLWQNSYDERTMISTLQLTFWEERGDGAAGERFEEVHQERAYTRKEVSDSLERAGFRKSWFYSHGTFLPVMPLTSRMMVVAK